MLVIILNTLAASLLRAGLDYLRDAGSALMVNMVLGNLTFAAAVYFTRP